MGRENFKWLAHHQLIGRAKQDPPPPNHLGLDFHWRASETLSGLFNRESRIYIYILLEKWFPLWGERAHSLKLFCMYDKRFEISKTK